MTTASLVPSQLLAIAFQPQTFGIVVLVHVSPPIGIIVNDYTINTNTTTIRNLMTMYRYPPDNIE